MTSDPYAKQSATYLNIDILSTVNQLPKVVDIALEAGLHKNVLQIMQYNHNSATAQDDSTCRELNCLYGHDQRAYHLIVGRQEPSIRHGDKGKGPR